MSDNLTSQSADREKGEGTASWFPVELDGKIHRPALTVRWKTNEKGIARLVKAGQKLKLYLDPRLGVGRPLRPMRPRLILGGLYRCNRRLISQSVRREPKHDKKILKDAFSPPQ